MKRFLIISSRPPSHSAGLGNDMVKALVMGGHEVDFLALATFMDPDEKLFGGGRLIKVADRPYGRRRRKWSQMFRKLKYDFHGAGKLLYPYEVLPKVRMSSLFAGVDKKYDAVITLYWQDMLNTASLRYIYRKLKCPILIYSPDMAPFTGGCLYPENCMGYTSGCGGCPIIGNGKHNDASRFNFKVKKRNYSRMRVAFMCNSWTNRYAERSGLFDSRQIVTAGIVLDETVFSPSAVHAEIESQPVDNPSSHSIPKQRFKILLRSSSEPRKGNAMMKEAIKRFCKLPGAYRPVTVLAIGDDYFSSLSEGLDIEVKNLGFVDSKQLIRLYNESDVFLSLSLHDAGPSMINQALMCGCPVVSFDNGTAVDVVVNGVSGYKSPVNDVEGIAEALRRLSEMDDCDRMAIRARCREMAMRHNSLSAFAVAVEEALERV